MGFFAIRIRGGFVPASAICAVFRQHPPARWDNETCATTNLHPLSHKWQFTVGRTRPYQIACSADLSGQIAS